MRTKYSGMDTYKQIAKTEFDRKIEFGSPTYCVRTRIES
jgi:hypothetical protein